MKALYRLFVVKIALTLALWCLPLLLLPAGWIGELGFPWMGSLLFLRLLGAAYGALVAAYLAGARHARGGNYPYAIVRVAIVSNGLAFACLLWAAIAGEWATWGMNAQAYMYASLVFTGLLAAGFTLLGPVARRKKK